MLKTLLLTAGVLALSGGQSSALTNICFAPDESCKADVEAKIFLDKKSDTFVGSGHVGSQAGLPLVQFASGVAADFDNGFATVKPTDKDTPINTFDISVPGHTFGDILWDAQLFNTKVKDALFSFTASAFLGGVLQESHTYTNLQHDADLSFGAFGVDGQFDELFLTSNTGFKELKHFQLSSLDGVVINPTGGVPEPSTWVMLGLGFLGLALASRNKIAKLAV